MGFPGGVVVKNLSANAEDLSLIPGLGRSPEGGHGKPFQVSLPGEPRGQRGLEGCSLWGHQELDTTEHTKNGSLNDGGLLNFSPSLSQSQQTQLPPTFKDTNTVFPEPGLGSGSDGLKGNHLQGSPTG